MKILSSELCVLTNKMSRKKYLNLLISCGILFQEILGIFAEESSMESSNLLIRKKRLLSSSPNAIVRMKINEVPYVVQVLENNKYICIGSILMPRIILTAAHCVEEPKLYHILSASEYVEHGNRHLVKRIIVHPEYRTNKFVSDLALLKIDPEIDIRGSPNRLIKIHNGFIAPHTTGLISGWGCIGVKSSVEVFPKELRSMIAPVISEEMCRRIERQFQRIHTITDRDICTMDKIEGNKCGTGDSGAPLVISNELVGVMAWNGNYDGPDVFVNLSHPAYRGWILEHLPSHPYYPDSPHHVRDQYYIHHRSNP